MTPSVHILAFSTSNYSAMLKFFRDFGFTIAEDPHDQLTPFFEQGRAARISRGEFEFQLEESESRGARACFNLFLTDYPDADIEKVKALGYTCAYESFRHTHVSDTRRREARVMTFTPPNEKRLASTEALMVVERAPADRAFPAAVAVAESLGR
jgi:hypothetical protein